MARSNPDQKAIEELNARERRMALSWGGFFDTGETEPAPREPSSKQGLLRRFLPKFRRDI